MIYREDEYSKWGRIKRVLATPEEEAEHIRNLADAIVETLCSEGAMSSRELKDRFWHRHDNVSRQLIDKILFADPRIAKIGNTKSRLYYYTDDWKEALPWWHH